MTVDAYVKSPRYTGDLHAARTVWEPREVLGGAGLFIFVTYATLPVLATVGSTPERGEALMLRGMLGMRREKAMLAYLLDTADRGELAGALANPAVRRMLIALGRQHKGLRGMNSAYMDLFAGVIAIAPLRTRAGVAQELNDETYGAYWHYMQQSFAILGAKLGDRNEVADAREEFIARNTGTVPQATEYIARLSVAYPRHMINCRLALFPRTRELIGDIIR